MQLVNQPRLRRVLTAGMAILVIGAAWAPSADAQGLVAYRGAILETVADAGTIPQGVLLVRDGQIEAIGSAEDVAIPDTAKIVDVSGQVIMPALVDAYHPINLGVVPAPPAGETITVRGRTFNAPRRGGGRATGNFVRIADTVDPITLERDLNGLARLGIGMTNLVTGGYGQAAHARTATADLSSVITSGDGYLYLPLTNDSMNLGQLRSGLSGGRGGPMPAGRGFRGGGGGRGRGRGGRGGEPPPQTPPAEAARPNDPDAAADLWKKVREGETRLILNVNNAATILHLLKELKEYEKVSVVLVASGEHVYQTLDAIKERPNLSIVMRPNIEIVPFSQNRMNVAKLLEDAKVDFGFCLSLRNDRSQLTDAPFFPVAMVVKSGLPREAALEALSLRPARILGLEKSLGSLEKGKTANLLFFDGDPLDPSSRLVRVVVDGNTIYEG